MSVEPTEGHAFISYVHEDSDEVDALEAFLEASGIHVWRDKNELWPGDEWKVEIRRAIQRNALAFIACFSEASTARHRSYQNEELILATEEYRLRRPGRPWLFPVRFGDVVPPPYDLGAGKTLDALQRTDLFGATREPNLGRLAMSVGRVIHPAPTTAASSNSTAETLTPTATDFPPEDEAPPLRPAPSDIKKLLRDPTRDIELDDYFTSLVDEARQSCLDPVEFPTTSDALRQGKAPAAQFVVERCDRYWEIVEPLCEAILIGCAWGPPEHGALLARTMKVIANTTPIEGGQQVLLDLRAYPRILVLYAGAIGALARDNLRTLHAITVDAKHRREGQNVPVIGVCNIWLPFSSADWIASAVARHTDGVPASAEEIEAFARRSGGRKTPVSDEIHTRLRDISRQVLPDDDDYDDTFDRVEVLLGVIAQDVHNTERAAGRYTHGGWVGRYAWRSNGRTNMFDTVRAELAQEGDTWPPLRSGFFGGDKERAEAVFEELSSQAHSSRFW
jgi:hypothetical protein